MTFQYEPLLSPQHIRLLTVIEHDHFTIAQHDLSTLPIYTCLSYRWDTTGDKQTIFINDRPFEIHEHLHKAISYLDGTVWIDAICINQQDVAEREAQVKIMGRVFEGAEMVYGYVGDIEAEDQIAAAQDLLEVFENVRNTMETCEGNTLTAEENGLLSSSHPGWNVLNQLFKSEYFTRRWIIQEYALAKHLRLNFGLCYIEVAALHHVVTSFTRIKNVSDYYCPAVNNLFCLAAVKGTKQPLIEALEICRTAGCTLPVDAVYALLGICSDAELFDVNYSQDTQSTFLDIATKLVELGYGIQVLYQKTSDSSRDMPSWVPDWSSPGEHNPTLWCSTAPKVGLLAGGSHSASAFVKGTTLTVNATIFDTVAVVGEEVNLQQKTSMRNKAIRDNLLKEQLSLLHTDSELQAFIAILQIMSGLSAMAVFSDITFDTFKALAGFNDGNFVDVRVHAKAAYLLLGLLVDRRLCRTADDSIGVMPSDTRPGDLLAVVQGAGVPFVLRRHEDSYILIGSCVVHGVMYGEVLVRPGYAFEEITLV